MRKPRLTLAEQERILEETIRLVKEPASWTTGKWKCNLYEVDKTGDFVLDDDGNWRRATDLNNRPLSQYCIEGGLNQATYNVLGKERALRLGAIRDGIDPETNDAAFDSSEYDLDPAELLGINKLAMEMYGERILDRVEDLDGTEHADSYEGENAAMILNDSFEHEDPIEGHKTILNLLQTRLERVRETLDAREEEAHTANQLVNVGV